MHVTAVKLYHLHLYFPIFWNNTHFQRKITSYESLQKNLGVWYAVDFERELFIYMSFRLTPRKDRSSSFFVPKISNNMFAFCLFEDIFFGGGRGGGINIQKQTLLLQCSR